MAIDYIKMAALSDKLIKQNGRPMTLVRLARGNPTDALKPWRGQTDPRDSGEPELLLNTTACFVEPRSFIRFGIEVAELDIRRAKEVIMVSANDTNEADLEIFNEIRDGGPTGTVYHIRLVRRLFPSVKRLFTVLGVSR